MSNRSILAVLAGIISGGLMIYIVHGILTSIYPINVEELLEARKTKATFRAYMLDQPLSVHIIDILVNGVSMLVGLMVGRFIDRENIMTLLVITAILLLGSVLNLLVVPHPTWFPFAYLIIPLAVSIGYLFTRKKA